MCNHTAGSRSQSGHSPKTGNTQDRPAADRGCTDRSCFCILSWTATICAPTAAVAAAACSLN